MNLLTRYQLAETFEKTLDTIISYTRGWYFRGGVRTYYFPDHFKVKAIDGKGVPRSPYLYDRKEVAEYIKKINRRRTISQDHKNKIGLGQKKRWAKLKVL